MMKKKKNGKTLMSETEEVLNKYIREIENINAIEDSISYSQDVAHKIDVLNESVILETEKQKIELRDSLTKRFLDLFGCS